jgi:hypothetical protein
MPATGEAATFEQAIAELAALEDEQRAHLDQCQRALAAVTTAKCHVGDMQDTYRAAAQAAQLAADQLAAKNLDGVTLAHAGTVVDAMPAGVVDIWFDQLEAMEAAAKERLGEAEIALASTTACRENIQVTLGDAHETVTGQLSGDASFLDSGGGHGPSIPRSAIPNAENNHG